MEFIAQLKSAGADAFKKCFQCATCTSVCGVSQGSTPFPRKEIALAQWGQKDKLLYDPGVWVCHQCGDCTKHCPRGADPSAVLSAIRGIGYRELAVPAVLGKFMSSPSYLVPLLAVPITVLLLVIMVVNGISLPEGDVVFSKLMPIAVIDSVFLPVAFFAVVTALLSIMKFWKKMSINTGKESNVVSGLIKTIMDVILHRRFSKCETNSQLNLSHLLTFYGFIALFITTNMVMAYHYLFGIETPLSLGDPVKMLGNAGAVLITLGLAWTIFRRLTNPKASGKAAYTDWTFIIALTLTALTGIGAELSRLGGMAGIAYTVYFIHLVMVFFLFAYMPFSKFAHILYRTTAMVFSNGIKSSEGR